MKSSALIDLQQMPTGTKLSLTETLDAVSWNEAGLIPAIAQDDDSGEVLMLAWMNREALLETLETRNLCYYSRSRQALWRKGETSGNTQKLVRAYLDCDGDTLLLQVSQKGAACHTNRPTCFYNALDAEGVEVRIMLPIQNPGANQSSE